jgi:hypothetical protein
LDESTRRERFDHLYGAFGVDVLAYGRRRVAPEVADDVLAERFLVVPPPHAVSFPLASLCRVTLHGYVYEDDSAHGVYFIEWCDGLHPDRAAFMTVGLGAFGARTDGRDRAAFCVAWRSEGMSLATEPARNRPDLLGEFVPRTAALEMPNIAAGTWSMS